MASRYPHPLVSYQPFKTFFQLAYIGSIIARLPLWLAASLFPFLRPHRSWTFKQTLMTRAAYVSLDMTSLLGITEPLSIPKDKKESRFQVIEPSGLDLYKGPLVSEYTKPAVTGGTWFPQAPGKDISTKLVVLYLHGGAFVQGDGREKFSGFLCNTFIQKGGVDALLSVQYRLSGYSNRKHIPATNPFPAALQDALTSYLYLLNELRIPRDQIILAGDSAGGNLAIALLRYIHEFGAELDIPLPRCVVLFSPWTAPFDYEVGKHDNFATDFLPVSFLKWGARTYGAGVDNAGKHKYITPLGNPFTTTVPVFVSYGTREVLASNITRWAREMMDHGGNTVQVYREVDACHDTALLGGTLGFEDSARRVFDHVAGFIQKV
ncbi:alpha/beta hydrolase fold-3 domain-containing protein [Poronia punctata]|nr:alpha/beta hydrolase fold-3 domain-containing protein [Poronia punctata]